MTHEKSGWARAMAGTLATAALIAAMSGTAPAQSPGESPAASGAPESMAPAASIPVPATPFTIGYSNGSASATASARSSCARPRRRHSSRAQAVAPGRTRRKTTYPQLQQSDDLVVEEAGCDHLQPERPGRPEPGPRRGARPPASRPSRSTPTSPIPTR